MEFSVFPYGKCMYPRLTRPSEDLIEQYSEFKNWVVCISVIVALFLGSSGCLDDR